MWQKDVKGRAFQDIVHNLEQHISIIGLIEDLATSYQTIEEAYGLPFVKEKFEEM